MGFVRKNKLLWHKIKTATNKFSATEKQTINFFYEMPQKQMKNFTRVLCSPVVRHYVSMSGLAPGGIHFQCIFNKKTSSG